MIEYNTLVVLSGVCVLGASAGMIGTFAVLRRRALTGDALAHAALPGTCLAFLATGEKRLPVLLLGALLSGLLGIGVIAALRRWTRIKEDAAVGVVLSVFFGAGLALLSYIQGLPTGSKAGLKDFIFGKTASMVLQDVQLIAGCAVGCLLLVLLLYKEFKLVAFDAGFARVQGWPAALVDLLLMAMLAVTVVIGLPAVGAVLMAALIILPGATARLWSDRLGVVLLIAAGVGAAAGLVGTALSATQSRMPTGPIIILVGSGFFLLSLLASPRHGVVARWLARRRFECDLRERQFLRVLFEMAEPALPDLPTFSSADVVRRRRLSRVSALLEAARRRGHVERLPDGSHRLTPSGLARAAAITKGQRLWALFLTEHAEQATGLADLARESVEGLLPAEQVAALERKLQQQGRFPTHAPRPNPAPVAAGVETR